MKTLLLGGAFALLFPTGLWLGSLSLAAQTKPDARSGKAELYEIDPVHSSVVFRVKHLGVSWFHGRFDEVGGSILFDEHKPEASSVSIEIPVESIDTNNSKRDQHVEGPDFFSAKEFPTITFNSSSVKASKDGTLEVTGDLTLHGETQSVTARTELVGAMDDPRQGKKRGFFVTFEFKRSEFGMEYGLPDALGDEIHVELGIEAGLKKE